MSSEPACRRLILLGSTGSIGTNVLEVVEHLHGQGLRRFEIVGLATGTNAKKLAEQARRFGVGHVAIADGARSPAIEDVDHVYTGPEAAATLIESVAREGDLVVGAMVGSAGLPATLAAIDRGCDIALANKETLVAAGELMMPLVRRRNVHLLPIDSEHSAIFQCLAAGRSLEEVQRLVLTASGGPFRTWPLEKLYDASVEEALNHPTWNMGPKITVDSASLMNKALEVVEAHWLFGMAADRIEVVIHPQSIVHSFVEFVDGSVLAQLGPPDMKGPIQYALTWPHRDAGCCRTMDWSKAVDLEFEPVDHERFPALGLAWKVVEAGGNAGAVFNAANEAAVAAFLERRIPFGMISQLVGRVLSVVESGPIESLDDVTRADRLAREEAQRLICELLHRAAAPVKSST